MRLCWWTLAILLAGSGWLQGQGHTQVTIHGERELGPVNRLLLGANPMAVAPGGTPATCVSDGFWDEAARGPALEAVRLAQLCGIRLWRWPGPRAGAAWDWKTAVGPRPQRPAAHLGLPEFLAWCRETQAEPVITVALTAAGAAEAADLVEYLNAPNDGANPNGGTEWAAVRAADGHLTPYGVTWFELDPELSQPALAAVPGEPTRPRPAPAEYARAYLEYRAAMRALDGRVKLGAAVPLDVETWSQLLLESVGEQVDFAVTPMLCPTLTAEASADQSQALLQAALAAGPQVMARWARLRARAREVCGRDDLQWAVCEAGNDYRPDRPTVYRHTLAAALGYAEFLRLLMQPEAPVAFVAHRQFADGHWGLVQGLLQPKEPARLQAAALVLQLYAQHFGETRLAATATGDAWEFGGAAEILPRAAAARPEGGFGADLVDAATTWTVRPAPGLAQQAKGTLLHVDLGGVTPTYAHATVTLPATPATWYRVRALLRTEDLGPHAAASLEISDGRSGAAAKPSRQSAEMRGTSAWAEVTVDYLTPADAEVIAVTLRAQDAAAAPLSGRLQARLVSLAPFVPANHGAVPDVTVNAARRRDGTLTVMLANTNLERDQTVALQVTGVRLKATSQARAWLLHGPSPWATNLGREALVRLWLPSPTRRDTGWDIALPRHALAAVEITP